MGNKLTWPEILEKKFELTSKDFEDNYFGTV